MIIQETTEGNTTGFFNLCSVKQEPFRNKTNLNTMSRKPTTILAKTSGLQK